MFIITARIPAHPRRHLKAGKAHISAYLPRALGGTPLLLTPLSLLLYQERKAFHSFLSQNLVSSNEELLVCLVFESLDKNGFDSVLPPVR